MDLKCYNKIHTDIDLRVQIETIIDLRDYAVASFSYIKYWEWIA